MGNLDKLAALKAARAAGGQNRLKSYKVSILGGLICFVEVYRCAVCDGEDDWW